MNSGILKYTNRIISHHHDTVERNESCENLQRNIKKSDSVKNLITSFGGLHVQAKLSGIKAVTKSSTTTHGTSESLSKINKVDRYGQTVKIQENEYITDVKDNNSFHKTSNVFGQNYDSVQIFNNRNGKNNPNRYDVPTRNNEFSAGDDSHRKIERKSFLNDGSKGDEYFFATESESTFEKDVYEDRTTKESRDHTVSQHGKSKEVLSSRKEGSSMRDLIHAFGGTRLNPSPFGIRPAQTNLTMMEGPRKPDNSTDVASEPAIVDVEEPDLTEHTKNGKPNDWKKTMNSEARTDHTKINKENYIDADMNKPISAHCPSSGTIHHRANTFGSTIPRNPSPFRHYAPQINHEYNSSEKIEDKNGERLVIKTSVSRRTSCNNTNTQTTDDAGVYRAVKESGEKESKENGLGDDSKHHGTSVRDRIKTFGGTRSNSSPKPLDRKSTRLNSSHRT